jgi:hypothetical protein
MKKFIKHSLLIIVILTACNDDFLEVVPLDRYSDATVWQDPALIESFVNNIYYGQKTGFTTVMLSSISDESMDVWSWNTQPVVNSLINSSDLGVLRPNHWCHSFDEFSWNSLYKNIRACNVFMKNIGESD